jgi:UDP-N-acetylmuramyl pentapeptide phosphotransferase/UDP-N-acetylglucosamine-1-phosphate transferase
MSLVLIGLAAFILSYFGVAGIRKWALQKNVLDVPNHRSSHDKPTPRGGGFAISTIVLVGFLIVEMVGRGLAQKAFLGYILGALLVAAIGALDDIFEISPKARLPIQLFAAGLFCVLGDFVSEIYVPFIGELRLGWLGFPLTILWITGFTNAFNFMDGIDGIAAGQAIVASLGWIVISSALGLGGLTSLSVLVMGASFGFLIHNLPPARIFMGDAGSTVLGYTFATLPILAFNQAHDSRLFVVGALCVAPFVFDTTLTVLRRALNKERIFQAHRSHLYQRLTKLGYFHGSVTLLYLAIASVSSLMGLTYLWGSDALAILALSVVAVLLAAIAAGVTWLEHSATS